ncbi:MAG: hypothetical protein AB7R90_05515 [Reyranellaceae bacterium]
MLRGLGFLLAVGAMALIVLDGAASQAQGRPVPKTKAECDQILSDILLDVAETNAAAVPGFLRDTNIDHILNKLCNEGQYAHAHSVGAGFLNVPKKGSPSVPKMPCERHQAVGDWFVYASNVAYYASRKIPMPYKVSRAPFGAGEPVRSGCTREGVCQGTGEAKILFTGKPGVVSPAYFYFPDDMAPPAAVEFQLIVGGNEKARATLAVEKSWSRADITRLLDGVSDVDAIVVKLAANGAALSQFDLPLKGRSEANRAAGLLNSDLRSRERGRACHTPVKMF